MSIERAELRESARQMFGASGLPADPDVVRRLLIEMGWLSLPVPAAMGGLGGDRSALCTLYCELGQVLAGSAYLSSILAIDAICHAPDFSARQSWIDRLATGDLVSVSLAGTNVDCLHVTSGTNTISGVLTAVPDADRAAYILLFLQVPCLCALVPMRQPGIEVTSRSTWDVTRRLFDVRFKDITLDNALVLATEDEAARLAERLHIHLMYALASDCIGGSAAALKMTVDYLEMRRQFDRPLGMFQALKHRCADLKTMIAGADALLWRLAGSGSDVSPDEIASAGALKAYAASLYRDVAEEAVQLHGGIGLTMEHTCHRFLKRALLNVTLGGDNDALEGTMGKHALKALLR